MKKCFKIFIAMCCIVMSFSVMAYADDSPQAKIGGTIYATLQEAIDAAKDGDTITVLKNISLTKDTTLKVAPEQAKTITIDLNQKEISYTTEDSGWDTAAIDISKPVTLNIKNGKIDSFTNSEYKELNGIMISCKEGVNLNVSDTTINAGYAGIYYTSWDDITERNKINLDNVKITSDEYGIHVKNSDITFESGSITTRGDETFYLCGNCSLTINDGDFLATEDTCVQLGDSDSTLLINGGTFTSQDDVALDIYNVKATINGGSFKGPEYGCYISGDSDVLLNGGTFEGGENAIYVSKYSDSKVTLGENLKSVLKDGTTLEDFLNSTYVRIEKVNVTVTFMSDGEKVAEVSVRKGQTISGDDLSDESMPENPTKDGYTFKEWQTAEDGSGDVFTDSSVVDDDTTVYAVYTKNSDDSKDNDDSAGKRNQGGDSNKTTSASEDTNETTVPETGDRNNMIFWAVLLIICSTALAGVFFVSRKKRQ